jgi:hypothetical protein
MYIYVLSSWTLSIQPYKRLSRTEKVGWGCSLVVDSLSSMLWVQTSVPKKKERKTEKVDYSESGFN